MIDIMADRSSSSINFKKETLVDDYSQYNFPFTQLPSCHSVIDSQSSSYPHQTTVDHLKPNVSLNLSNVDLKFAMQQSDQTFSESPHTALESSNYSYGNAAWFNSPLNRSESDSKKQPFPLLIEEPEWVKRLRQNEPEPVPQCSCIGTCK